jgi:hypothetical protein
LNALFSPYLLDLSIDGFAAWQNLQKNGDIPAISKNLIEKKRSTCQVKFEEQAGRMQRYAKREYSAGLQENFTAL